ncbi:Flp family type IVb pilin [Altericroceibacterium xinjiangense]|uniref:Flp family type IVb pilin n=1 Tax=Altericroceibacterium xinjiangense TaxID=762261 RepID=UPI000F7DF64D|nr:Flp family type IVb pilin [Altericroceibacterium xinjiangense]
MFKLIRKLSADNSGATAIEYGMIAALISLGVIVAANTIGGNLTAKFQSIATETGTAAPTA